MKVVNAYLMIIRFSMADLNLLHHNIEIGIIKAVNESFSSRDGLILYEKKHLPKRQELYISGMHNVSTRLDRPSKN